MFNIFTAHLDNVKAFKLQLGHNAESQTTLKVPMSHLCWICNDKQYLDQKIVGLGMFMYRKLLTHLPIKPLLLLTFLSRGYNPRNQMLFTNVNVSKT